MMKAYFLLEKTRPFSSYYRHDDGATVDWSDEDGLYCLKFKIVDIYLNKNKVYKEALRRQRAVDHPMQTLTDEDDSDEEGSEDEDNSDGTNERKRRLRSRHRRDVRCDRKAARKRERMLARQRQRNQSWQASQCELKRLAKKSRRTFFTVEEHILM